ncbi:MAG TPA: acyl-CoA dehydrogenase family protein, partial [Micromonosporaceae bacterium]|nr:acyl-CoA dehydrogenase family protein [Micromonosporaceae bacterium]
MTSRTHPLDLLDIDALHSEEELAIRAVVRQVVDEKVRPHVADWYERGEVPARILAADFGKLGLLGMHLTGYGCAGATAVAYGLACLELEAADSGVRSLVSVQGSLAMYAIWRYGSEEQKERWLPRMASGELIGCFGLTEPDHGSDPASMRTRADRNGDGWVLRGGKMWITNAPIADLAVVWAQTDGGLRGFIVPMDVPGVGTREIKRKLSLRASSTGEITLDEVRLPADALLPGADGLKAPLSCLTEARYGIIWGALGAAR